MERSNDKKAVLGIIKNGIRFIKYVFEKAPVYTLIQFTTLVALAIIPLTQLWFTSNIIDKLIGITGELGSDEIKGLSIFIGLSILFLFLKTIISNLNLMSEQNLWFKVGRDLQLDVTKKLSFLDLERYENPKTRNLLNKITENYTFRPQQFMSNIFYSVELLTTLVTTLIILVAFKPYLLLIIVVAALPQFIVNIDYGEKNWGIWDAQGDVKKDFYRTRDFLVTDNPLMEISIYNLRNFLLKRMQNLYDIFQNTQVRLENKRTLLSTIYSLISVMGTAVAFVTILLAVVASKITVGYFTFLIETVANFQDAFEGILKNTARMYENGLYINDIFEFLDLPTLVIPGTTVLSNKLNPPLIEFRDVTFVYPGKKTPVFENLNLTIKSEEHVAIVGKNGAGKTTLIKLLMRFYDVTSGEILIDNINIKDLDLGSWYSKVGVLFQDFNFYHFDAKTNIGVGNINDLDNIEKITEAAKKSGADDFIQDYDKKYDQVLDKTFEGGITPSTGQKQRIALARTFFKDAPILILDEPTSAIDPKAEYEIFQQLFSFSNGKTLVIVSHRFSTVRNASRIVVLEKGRITEEGTHEQLMDIENGKYKTAFNLQKKGYE